MSQIQPRPVLLAMFLALGFMAVVASSPRPASALACADLLITNLSVSPTSPVEDINATISITVKNEGSCDAIGFVVQWKQSVFSPTGPSQAIGALAAGASTTINLPYAFPTSGNFLTIATVDTANAVEESIETNNTAIKSVTVQRPGTDLVIVDVFFNPDPAVSTEAMTATVRVQNIGNTAAGQFRVQWKPSPFGVAQSQQVNSLAAGAVLDVQFPYTYALPGTFNTNARVDVLNSVFETNEFNNTFDASLVVDPPFPDLDITNVSISPANPVAGQPAQLTVTITNVGHAPAGDFQVRWKPSLLGLPLTQQVNGPLNEGASVNVVFDYTYAIGGTFTGTITADSASRILEVSEANNTEDFPVTVSVSNVDLTITSFSYTPANPVQGENVQFSVTIQNLGNTAANNFEVSVNPDAFQISTPSLQTLTRQVNSLAGGASQVLLFDFEYPQAGNFRAIAEVDAFQNIFETNEANNKALANLVLAPADIDLEITDFTLDTDLCAQAVGYGNACSPMLYFKGSAVTASIEVTNNGTFPAGPFVVQWLPNQDSAFGPLAVVEGLLPGASTVVELQGSFATDGSITSKATVDLFDQVVEPCGGCEANNTDTTTVNVLNRDTSITMSMPQFTILDDIDSGDNPGDWYMWFIAFDPNSTCDLGVGVDEVDDGEFILNSSKCAFFFTEENAVFTRSGPSLSLDLKENQPVIIALTGLEDDVTCDLFGCDIEFDFPGYTYQIWLPGDYQNAGTTTLNGQGGDCGAGHCFDVNITVTVTKGPPPPASSSIGLPGSSVSVSQAEAQLAELIGKVEDIAE